MSAMKWGKVNSGIFPIELKEMLWKLVEKYKCAQPIRETFHHPSLFPM
jgi:hypothetical protein